MAANTSKNEVAAKMIGAQLQSLLKIPPIKKNAGQEPPQSEGKKVVGPATGAKEKTREFPVKETKGYLEEKENSRHLGNADNTGKGSPYPPTSGDRDGVARDRFGRPFQSLDTRRGRGGRDNRDFHNAPKRQINSLSQQQREPPPPSSHQASSLSSELTSRTNAAPAAVENVPTPGNHQSHSTTSNKGRPNAVAPQQQPPPQHPRQNIQDPSQPIRSAAATVIAPTPVAVIPAVGTNQTVSFTTSTTNSFEDKQHKSERFKQFPTYDPPPRFAVPDNPFGPNGRDLVDPQVRLLARKPDCPGDIKEKIDHFHDNDSKSWPNDTASDTLRSHFILCLHRKNPKFPRARYYCSCCNYHLDTLNATLNHLLQDRHFCLEKMGIITGTLARVPNPSGEHASYLTDLLIKTSKLHGMNNTERGQRMEVGRRLAEAIKEHNLDCTAAVFGSTLSGFGFRDSNVNININVGSETAPLPGIDTEQPTSPRTPGGMSNNAEFAGVTTKLLGIIKQLPYVSEHKVKEVYTPKCVSIHFDEDKSRTSCVVHFNNNSAVMAAQLFAEYDQLDARVKPLVLCFRHWARICDLDDQEKGFLPAHCFTIMVIHFLQSHYPNVLPILHLIPKVNNERPFATADEAKKHWKTRNTETIGDLWLELLKFYALEFDWKTKIVSISRYTPVIPKDEKQWNRRLCIEDPILPKSNLSRSVTNNKICEYIIDRIKLAYQYFAIPRKETGALYEGILERSRPEELTQVVIENSKPTTSQALQRMVRQIQKANNEPRDEDDWTPTLIPENEVRMGKIFWKNFVKPAVCREDVKKLHDVLFKKEYNYEFKAENFNDGTLPPIICKSCGAEGHLKTNCPEETVPPYLPVEYPTPLTLTRLNSAVALNYERDALDSRDVAVRTRIVEEVRAILLPVFPSVNLTLFGSTFNGFGMHASDVDICLTFKDVITPPGERGIRCIDVNDVLEKIVNALKLSGRMMDILSIPSAKVPIVKFRHLASKLEGDISLYNRLSIYNTELLRSYVDLDTRVARLGLFLKKLVKLCDVGDASKGSLSSYSYILMLIHFLQNHAVPVLPVIQELELPNMEIFLCDSSVIKYHADVGLIARTWEGYGRNKESVSQLWLAFLNYYVEKFDHDKYVISISQSAPLTRASKCWYTDALAIEDPFDKTHNLGSGLTRRMSVHILKTFQKCRMFFHRSTDHLRNDVNYMEYYLDARQVRDGNPPIDRQCRLCYRIGHFARNCTYVNKREEDETPLASQDILRDEADILMNGGGVQQRVTDRLPPNFVMREQSPTKAQPPVMQLQHPQHQQIMQQPQPIGPPVPAPEPRPRFNNSPWPTEPVKREISPPAVHHVPNGTRATPVDNVIRRPEVIAPPKPKPTADTAMISHSLNALIQRSRELEEAAAKLEANKPVKEVIFFGDIGSPNAEGDQLQKMLQKNEGVEFTFDLGAQQPPPEVTGARTINNSVENSNHVVGMGNQIISQPPPGFCPPNNNIYVNGPTAPGLPYLTEQAPSRPVIPTPPVQPFNLTPIGMPIQPPQQQQQQQQQQPHGPIPFPHNPASGMPLPFPAVMSVGPVPSFDNRPPQLVNGDSVERVAPQAPQQPIGASTAPPPGFAPLPTASTACLPQPTELLRPYPTGPFQTTPVPAAAAPGAGTMFSMTPVAGLSYQQLTNNVNFTSASSSAVASSESIESGLSYRPLETGMPTPLMLHQQAMAPMMSNFQNLIPINANLQKVQQQHIQQHHQHHHQQQMENGSRESTDSPGGYPKISSLQQQQQPESGYNLEYGIGGGMLPGSTPVSSYGLSLSQAHHGPVVSALQMQHSLQMQGTHAHFPHHLRPIMAIGNYHHGSAFTMHPPMHPNQPHGMEHPMMPLNPDNSMLSQNPAATAVDLKQAK